MRIGRLKTHDESEKNTSKIESYDVFANLHVDGYRALWCTPVRENFFELRSPRSDAFYFLIDLFFFTRTPVLIFEFSSQNLATDDVRERIVVNTKSIKSRYFYRHDADSVGIR